MCLRICCLCDANFRAPAVRFLPLALRRFVAAGRFIEFLHMPEKSVKKQAVWRQRKTASMVAATKRVVAHFCHSLIYSFSSSCSLFRSARKNAPKVCYAFPRFPL